jgi:hypothetical protein|tara:strand:- start:249 stop:638 length:390 start_codon:yes stop_codon:yes gene_type:complete
MATLNVSLTLSSTDVSSDNLNMTVTDALTVGPPQEFLSKVVLEANSGSDTVIKPAGSAGNHYLYVKHTGLKGDGSAATNAVVLKLASTSLSVLVPGEISFFNVINSGVINAISSSSETILLEYGFFTKA